jgi:DNA-binding MarR family transcriptional regulator
LSELEMRAWRSYVETQSDLQTAIEADLQPTGLNLGDYQVLVFLSEADGRRMRMCDLAELLQLSPSGLTRRLDGLVRKGLVQRVGSDLDRRVMLAVLTPDGLAELEAAAPTHVDSVRSRLVDLLDDDELEALDRIFTKVRAALDR